MKNKKMKNEVKKQFMTELCKDLTDFARDSELETDSMVLYVLHKEFGFGKERLKRFYKAFHKHVLGLGQHYEMNDEGDLAWLCRHKLMEIGIDIQEWAEEEMNEVSKIP